MKISVLSRYFNFNTLDAALGLFYFNTAVTT